MTESINPDSPSFKAKLLTQLDSDHLTSLKCQLPFLGENNTSILGRGAGETTEKSTGETLSTIFLKPPGLNSTDLYQAATQASTTGPNCDQAFGWPPLASLLPNEAAFLIDSHQTQKSGQVKSTPSSG